MNREEQRLFAALSLRVTRLARAGESSHPASVHLNEIVMEHLQAADVEFFKDYTAEQRRRMAKAGQAMPDGSFPIGSCADAENAIHAVGRAKNPDKVKAFIKRRVRSLGCTGPIFENWR